MALKHTPESFWKRVKRSAPQECWPWTGYCVKDGYGRLIYHMRQWTAHRLAWALSRSEPGKLCVLHSCDNPPCCNPAHLFLGTRADNNADMKRKGRHPRNKTGYLPSGDAHFSRLHPEWVARGERSGTAKLSRKQVVQIRKLRTHGMKVRVLAARFGVATQTIRAIVERITWRHL